LSITSQQISQLALNQMQLNCAWKPITVYVNQTLAAYANAFGTALESALLNLKLLNGIVSGGTSLPGGPLIGAELAFAPGSVQAPGLDLGSVFIPPTFTMQVGNQLRTGFYHPWMKTLTSVLSNQLKLAWAEWYPLWSLPSFACVSGGVSAWIPPVPPAPPFPGPWSGGIISVPVSFNLPGQGQSASPSMAELSNTVVAVAKATPVLIPVDNNDNYIDTQLCITKESEKLIRCIADAYTSVFNSTTSSLVLAADETTVFSGIAYPPTGTVTGSVTELVLQ
jgi:hypothetical protein